MRAYYHLEISDSVFRKYLSFNSTDRVNRYNFGVDFYGIIGWEIIKHKIFPLLPFARYWYKEEDHFDQQDTEGAIKFFRLHSGRLLEILDDEVYPPPFTEPMFRILGRSTHAVADIFSHSNLVELLYDYHREDPAAARALRESGLELPRFVAEKGPLFAHLLDAPEHEAFREKYLPKLFTLQSVPDEGSRSHEECNLDCPEGPGSNKENYPGAFDAAFGLASRETAALVDTLFARLKDENPEKYELLTGAYRGPGPDPEGPGPSSVHAKWWCDRFGVWK